MHIFSSWEIDYNFFIYIYIYIYTGEEMMWSLLHQENKHGYNALEFATQQGCLLMMKTLLETKGHVVSETKRGLVTYRFIDTFLNY